MTDIFISYSSKDRDWIKPFADLLEEQGYRVWWDTGLLAGHDFQRTIPEKLAEAGCVIVVWTEHSVDSIWVRAEANRALSRGILVPVWLRDAEIPMPFDIIHAEDFRDWKGDKQSDVFKRLLLAVARHAEPSLLIEQANQERSRQQGISEAQRLEQQRLKEEADEKVRLEQQRLAEAQRVEQQRLQKEVAEQRQQAERLQRERETATRKKKVRGAVLAGLRPSRGMILAGAGVLIAGVVVWQWPYLSGLADGEGSVEPEMVSIPGGTFMMGCISGKGCRFDEEPVRDVTIPAFEMGKYEVTFAQWDECLKQKGCQHKPDASWGRGDQPVMRVSWNDAQEYVGWLSEKTGKKYRLPTEAEWEYAARAGTTPFLTGNCINTDQANYNGNYGWDAGNCPKTGKYHGKTISVGSFAKNKFGLFDMHGNVREWTQDCYHSDYNGAPKDGSAWESGCGDTVNRGFRGGSWFSAPESLRSAYRNWSRPTERNDAIGFRIARTL